MRLPRRVGWHCRAVGTYGARHTASFCCSQLNRSCCNDGPCVPQACICPSCFGYQSTRDGHCCTSKAPSYVHLAERATAPWFSDIKLLLTAQPGFELSRKDSCKRACGICAGEDDHQESGAGSQSFARAPAHKFPWRPGPLGQAWEWLRSFLLSAEFQQMLQLAAGKKCMPCSMEKSIYTQGEDPPRGHT